MYFVEDVKYFVNVTRIMFAHDALADQGLMTHQCTSCNSR